MSGRLLLACYVFGATGALCAAAQATTEPPTPFDARAVGMGSTAVAHVHSAAAVYHNAAALHEVKALTLTADFAVNRVAQSAPLTGPDPVDSDPEIVPLFLVGGAYRLSEKFLIGLAAFTTGGFGGSYDTPAGRLKAALGAIEISPTLTYSLTPTLAIGVGYRISYLMQKLEQPIMPAPGTFVDSKLEMSGTDFTGFHAGLYFHPIAPLKLGFAYRSEVTRARGSHGGG